MKGIKFNIIYCVFVAQLIAPIIGSENTTCSNDVESPTDLILFTQDFGRKGIKGPKTFSLPTELQPGSVISVVAKSKIRGIINLRNDEENVVVLHIDARFNYNSNYSIVLNTHMNYDWTKEIYVPLHISNNSKGTTTIIYETNGFRIFVNGKEVYFFEHRTEVIPIELEIKQDYIYKVMYSLLTLKTEEKS